MIIALYIKTPTGPHFRMAVSQLMPAWSSIVETKRDKLERAGYGVVERYYTEGEWAKQMPARGQKGCA